jgi:16S rRNA (adenine1518-N6/adenine1519-N6)-dimethyltransferase
MTFAAPRKRLGQHFLTDRHMLTRIADAVAAGATETVVEIGPGRGALTELLVSRAAHVAVIELDRLLAAALRQRYAGDQRVTVIEGDVLDLPLSEAAGTAKYVVAGNVPYYITTPILFHTLRPPRPTRTVLLVQREVAERVVSAPGSEAYGALSANVQAIARPEIVGHVPAGAFTPRPSVESAILRLVPLAKPVVSDAEQSAFGEFVIAAFGARRKQMRRVLRTVCGISADDAQRVLEAAVVPIDARPEVLTPEQFATVWRGLGG